MSEPGTVLEARVAATIRSCTSKLRVMLAEWDEKGNQMAGLSALIYADVLSGLTGKTRDEVLTLARRRTVRT